MFWFAVVVIGLVLGFVFSGIVIMKQLVSDKDFE